MKSEDIKKIANAIWARYKISGKSFKYNQICDISNVSLSSFGVNASVENNKIKFVGTATSTRYQGIGIVCNRIVDHYYAILINNNTDNIDFNVVSAGGIASSSKIEKATATDNRITILIENEKVYNSSVELQVVDLTDLFGAGNEPTTLEQFYATDLGKEIQKGFVPPYSATNTIYEATAPLTFAKPRLPDAYQEVEYIESTGTQWIDSGFVSTINSVLICNIAFTQTSGTQINGIYSTSCRMQLGILDEHYWFGVGNKLITTSVVPDLAKHTFTIDIKNKQYGLDDNLTTDSSIITSGNNKSLLLFCMLNATANTPVYYCRQKLYSCQIYDNSVLVRNFIPCYRKSDNVIGMYDLVNGVFYTNQGTGTFLKGNDNDVIGEKQTVSILQNGQPLRIGGIGTAKDYYLNASGKVNRAIGNVDMGTLSWNYSSSTNTFYVSYNLIKDTLVTQKMNGICEMYEIDTDNNVKSNVKDKTISYTNATTYLRVYNSDYTDATTFKTSLNGVYLHYELATPTTEQVNSVMLRKGFTKCYDKNNLELEMEVIDPLNFSNKIVQGKNSPTITAEKVITKGFTSGGEHFTQLYIYEDGEIWYVNGDGSAQAYASGVWELEYKQLQFDNKVSLTESERNALLNIYDLI